MDGEGSQKQKEGDGGRGRRVRENVGGRARRINGGREIFDRKEEETQEKKEERWNMKGSPNGMKELGRIMEEEKVEEELGRINKEEAE